MNGLFKGVGERWVSLDVLEISADVAETGVEVGDYWETHQHNTRGVYYMGSPNIVVSQSLEGSYGKQIEDLKSVLDIVHDHEQCHKHFGAKMPQSIAWLDEAMAEHVSLALKHGQPLELNPDARLNDSGVYAPYRRLAHYMSQYAPGGSVGADYLTRAYTSAGRHSKDWRAFEGQLDEKWGVQSFLQKLSNYYNKRARGLSSEGRSLFEAQDEAARLTLDALQKDPKLILGSEWKRPASAIYASAGALAVNI